MKDKLLKHCEKLNVKLQEDSKSKNTETSKEKDAVCDEEEPKNIEGTVMISVLISHTKLVLIVRVHVFSVLTDESGWSTSY
jgi:hypothetical protein